jgi:hypothetical protein
MVMRLLLEIDGFRLLICGPQAVGLLNIDHSAATRRCLDEKVFLYAETVGKRKQTGYYGRENCSKTSPGTEATSL